jgi:hypothetical protein
MNLLIAGSGQGQSWEDAEAQVLPTPVATFCERAEEQEYPGNFERDWFLAVGAERVPSYP